MKKNKMEIVISILFIIYLILLIWIILFKASFSIDELENVRSINLIPFRNGVGNAIQKKEIMLNVEIFVPFGIYLCMLNYELRFKVRVIFGVSFLLELFQYILGIGRTDITDLITNTCGGILGIGSYYIAVKIFRRRERVNFIISIIATLFTIIMIVFIGVLASTYLH